ncbi:hypothetical protein [Pseudoalteromonas sp. NZS37]|uniref:hypothetical protein n=1 Tax=Pseudoalteromonas sp. NZS37 TaxID=2792071 RepID=UPI0018CEF64D|nr:hypothetical protein [Pseudoalteromonas sp. NZS37]MBG9991570.1 hypothetical protein [Pseudoalteromonas sp. NZS37]
MANEKVFKHDGTTFGAKFTAEEWLRENGFSYGSSSHDGPQGIVKGDAYIAKYRHLSKDDKEAMDGWLYAGRDQDARIIFNN